MNGKLDARLVLKQAMEVAAEDKLHYGVSARNIQAMLKLIVRMHRDEGRNVQYVWRRVNRNHATKGKGWSGKNCSSTFKNAGKYIIIGKTKREDDSHKARVKRVRVAESESERLETFASYAKGEKRADHAIAIDVNKDGQGVIFDNGCSLKECNILNLASRMEDVKTCYMLDLYYEK